MRSSGPRPARARLASAELQTLGLDRNRMTRRRSIIAAAAIFIVSAVVFAWPTIHDWHRSIRWNTMSATAERLVRDSGTKEELWQALGHPWLATSHGDYKFWSFEMPHRWSYKTTQSWMVFKLDISDNVVSYKILGVGCGTPPRTTS